MREGGRERRKKRREGRKEGKEGGKGRWEGKKGRPIQEGEKTQALTTVTISFLLCFIKNEQRMCL